MKDLMNFRHNINKIRSLLGGGIFKPEWFYLLDEEPYFLATFIAIDTAETDKTYNDATVFSFWGLYKINNNLSCNRYIGTALDRLR